MKDVPNDWKVLRMAEAGEIGGGRQRSPHLIKGELRPYLRVANVMDGFIDISDVKEMKFTESEFEQFKLRIGDILLNEGQSLELCGRPAIYKGTLPNCCFQNTLIRFRARDGTDSLFALHLFKFLLASGQFSSIASQTTSIAHLGVSRFAGLKAAFPPVDEQRRIASVLETCDRGIHSQQSLVAAKVERKRGLMQQLLTGKTRFKEFKGEKWRTYRLGELFSERVEMGRTDLPLVAITGQNGVVPRDSLTKRDTSSEDKSKYLSITPGDIGYNTMRMWQGVAGLSKIEGIVSPAYTILIPSEKIDAQFAAYLFKHAPVINLFRRYSQGLVDDTLALKFPNFAVIHVTIPYVLEQRRIAGVLSAFDREIELMERQLAVLKEQKRGLMQKLLNGEVRVKF